MKTLILAAALASTPGPFDTDLPYALGTAVAYSEGCQKAGFLVGDVGVALTAMRSAAPEAYGSTLQAARIAAERLGRSREVNRYLPEPARLEADLELVRPVCAALADSRYGSTLVRRAD